MRRGSASKRWAVELALGFALGWAFAATPGEEEARAVRELLARDAWREALARAERAVSSAGASADVRAALAEALFRAGRLVEAEREAEAALAGGEAPPRALLVLGRLRQAQGRHREARTLLERARRLAPGDLEILYWSAAAAATRSEVVERLRAFVARAREREGYADRVEAALGKIRLYEALGERPVWVARDLPRRAALSLFPLPDGRGGVRGYTFRLGFPEGKPVDVLFDTGSGGLFLLERIARRRGFEPLADETVFGGGREGRHRSRSGLFEWVRIGPLRFENPLATTTPRELHPTGRFHGLLGLGPFESYAVHLDLERGRVALERGGECPPEAWPYWQIAGQILFEAAVLPSGERVLFLLDTGADRTTISLAVAEGLKGARLGPALEVRGYGGRWGPARRVSGVRVRAGELEGPPGAMRAVDLSLRSRMAGVEVSGFLGLDFLQGRHVIVVPAARCLWIGARPPRGAGADRAAPANSDRGRERGEGH